MLYELLSFKDKEFPAGMGWHDRILEGFPMGAFWSLARRLGVQAEDVAQLVEYPVLDVHWHDRKNLLSADASDILFRVALAYNRLHVLFKNDDLVSNWLRKPRKETLGQVPILLLTTSPGSKVVFDAIERIKPVKRMETREDIERAEAAERLREEGDPDEV